jgi:hypothetical protein
MSTSISASELPRPLEVLEKPFISNNSEQATVAVVVVTVAELVVVVESTHVLHMTGHATRAYSPSTPISSHLSKNLAQISGSLTPKHTDGVYVVIVLVMVLVTVEPFVLVTVDVTVDVTDDIPVIVPVLVAVLVNDSVAVDVIVEVCENVPVNEAVLAMVDVSVEVSVQNSHVLHIKGHLTSRTVKMPQNGFDADVQTSGSSYTLMPSG